MATGSIVAGGGGHGRRGIIAEVPYELPVADAVNFGWCLTVRGAILDNPTGFTLNLRTADGNIALHLNPRFQDDDAGRVVVLNSQLGDSWGSEERPGEFPFSPGEPFEVRLRCCEDVWRVEVNDVIPLCDFHHRAEASSITGVHISGDVSLSAVETS
ncbi:galectin-7-like isoform X1 [Lampetra fluviatilis]